MRKLYSTRGKVFKVAIGCCSLVAVLVCGILLSGCSDYLDNSIEQNKMSNESIDIPVYKITKDDAIEIADKVLRKTATRSDNDNPTFEYVLNETPTRCISLSDTLAYVLNYPDNGGFVIVSTDRRVYPVLAYSNEGQFSFDNEIAKTNFIDNIGTYMEENVSDSLYRWVL